MKTALVLGAGGFIGHHMVNRLKSEGYWVRGVDIKNPEFEQTRADHFVKYDLRNPSYFASMLVPGNGNEEEFDEIYQFAADMGGAGFVFTGKNDANIMHNSCLINLNLLHYVSVSRGNPKVFYASSACVYPAHNQTDPQNPICTEDSAYPADPDSDYGWEKLYSERLYQAFERNHGIDVRIARYHNIYGPMGTWDGGREKAPAAICRKVIESKGEVEVWGDGTQTRSFLFIDDAIEATRKLMNCGSLVAIPVNIGSEEMVTINRLVDLAASVERKKVFKKWNIDAPIGVMGRCSDNHLIAAHTGWKPLLNLNQGLTITYKWIERQMGLTKTTTPDKILGAMWNGAKAKWKEKCW